jgi:hypothetical protein
MMTLTVPVLPIGAAIPGRLPLTFAGRASTPVAAGIFG